MTKRQLRWRTNNEMKHTKNNVINVMMKITVKHTQRYDRIVIFIQNYPTYVIRLLSFRIIFCLVQTIFFVGNAWNNIVFFSDSNSTHTHFEVVFWEWNIKAGAICDWICHSHIINSQNDSSFAVRPIISNSTSSIFACLLICISNDFRIKLEQILREYWSWMKHWDGKWTHF